MRMFFGFPSQGIVSLLCHFETNLKFYDVCVSLCHTQSHVDYSFSKTPLLQVKSCDNDSEL